ncbi:hypothetical protein ALC53_11066 [Atta colombica]|uniref:Uncharacterized protein n=1 Tax=Atta colombica TaxID=520822 RepID=A0A195B1R2_9HYME|nr:hypothetical protein ALC53_11066 [Atta colombica]
MNKLGELGGAKVAGVWLLTRVQSKEMLHLDLTGMHEMMLLEMRELSEAFGTNVTFEGPFARMRPQVYLEI